MSLAYDKVYQVIFSLNNDGKNYTSLKGDIHNCFTNNMVNDKLPHDTNWATSKMTPSIMIIFLDLMKDKLCQRSAPTNCFSNNLWSKDKSHNLIITHYISMVPYTFQRIFTSICHMWPYIFLYGIYLFKVLFTWPTPAKPSHIPYELLMNLVLTNVCLPNHSRIKKKYAYKLSKNKMHLN